MPGQRRVILKRRKGEVMKIHSALLAPVVGVVFLGVILMGSAWELPSMQKQFGKSAEREKSVEMIVNGLRCRGTSNFFMKVVGEIPGVVSVSTYVQEHRASIKYDPSQINPDEIAEIINEPVNMRNGRTAKPFQVTEIKR